MANIELVIKIPEGYYKAIMEIPVKQSTADMLIIRNGTPLPKGHGDLVDFDKLCREYWDGNYMEIHRNDLQSIKPIIEAYKAESEE